GSRQRRHRAGDVADRARRDGGRQRRQEAHAEAPLLSRPRVQHRGGPPDPGEQPMTKTVRIALAGPGAFGIKHLDGLKNIEGVEVTSIIGRELGKAKEVADKYGAKHVTDNLDEALARPDVDAVILCTPTQMHAAQSIAALKAGKHVQVEIPLCDKLDEGRAVVETQKKTGLV